MKPIFHDTEGLTAAQWRERQLRESAPPNPTDANILAYYRKCGNWTETGEYFNISRYKAKQAVARASQAERSNP